LEQGAGAAWLHNLLKPHLAQMPVYGPRKNNLGKLGNKNDRNDAGDLAEVVLKISASPSL
jgi:hypothetical protein